MSDAPYGFGNPPPPGDVNAVAFLHLLKAALEAEDRLIAATEAIPSYTAQWSDIDYIGQEVHERNVAAKELYNFVFTQKVAV